MALFYIFTINDAPNHNTFILAFTALKKASLHSTESTPLCVLLLVLKLFPTLAILRFLFFPHLQLRNVRDYLDMIPHVHLQIDTVGLYRALLKKCNYSMT